MASQGGEVVAKEIRDFLTADLNINLPVIDWNDPIWQLPIDENSDIFKNIPKILSTDLTNGCGEGVFDLLMKGFKFHLEQEYKAQRITGAEYTKAYIALTESAMSNATQFLLQKDQAFWQAAVAQLQAFAALVGTQTAKAEYVRVLLEAQTAGANYALTSLKLSNEDMAFGTAKYNLANILPQQYKLVQEQTEVQRAQTQDTRTDGSPIDGVLGKQRDLYDQQIDSYQEDSQLKAARLFADAWTVQKTVDEGLEPPDGFTNAQVQKALAKVQQRHEFV